MVTRDMCQFVGQQSQRLRLIARVPSRQGDIIAHRDCIGLLRGCEAFGCGTAMDASVCRIKAHQRFQKPSGAHR
jgi:hypothetical protein